MSSSVKSMKQQKYVDFEKQEIIRQAVLRLASQRAQITHKEQFPLRQLTLRGNFDAEKIVQKETKTCTKWEFTPMFLGAMRVVRYDFDAETRAIWVFPVSEEYLSRYSHDVRATIRSDFPRWASELHDFSRPLKLGLPSQVGWSKRDNSSFHFYNLDREMIHVEDITGAIIHPTLTEVGKRDRIVWFRISSEVVVRSLLSS